MNTLNSVSKKSGAKHWLLITRDRVDSPTLAITPVGLPANLDVQGLVFS
jgi:hypothetical protein